MTFGGRDYSNKQAPVEERQNERMPDNRPLGDGGGSAGPTPGERDNRRGGGSDVPRGGGGYDNQGYGRGNRGGGNSGGGGSYDRDPNFAMISYLYATGNKGGFSVFLKRDMLEILKSLDEDDVVGISPSGGKNGAPMGWMMYARRIDAQQKEEYRRNGGGRGRGNGGGDGRGGYRR